VCHTIWHQDSWACVSGLTLMHNASCDGRPLEQAVRGVRISKVRVRVSQQLTSIKDRVRISNNMRSCIPVWRTAGRIRYLYVLARTRQLPAVEKNYTYVQLSAAVSVAIGACDSNLLRWQAIIPCRLSSSTTCTSCLKKRDNLLSANLYFLVCQI